MSQKSIKKNMIMNIILTMSNIIFPLITFSYVSRILTPIGTGKVAFVASILSYFSYIAILGIPGYGLREAAKLRDNKDKLSKFVHEMFIINMISTFVSYFLLFISILFIQKLQEYKLLFLIMSIDIFLNTIGLEWIYKSLEEYSYITKRSLIFKVIYLVLIFLLIKSPNDYLIYGFLSIFVTSASYICNFVNIRKFIKFKKYEKYELKKHLKPMLILFSASVIITIYSNFDISMIGFIKGEYEVGLYNTALKIKSIVLSLSTAITAVLIPRIAYNISKNKKDEIKRLIELSIRVSMLLALPLAIYIFIFSKDVILFMSGNDYIAANFTLKTLMICVIPLIFTNLFGNQILIPYGNEKRFTQSVFIGLFINIFLNILLIPSYGAFGAAIGTLVTETWNVIWMGLGCKKIIKDLKIKVEFDKYIISILIASLLSFAFSLGFYFIKFSLIVRLIISSILFFGTYFGLLLIFKDNILLNEINKIFRRFKHDKK